MSQITKSRFHDARIKALRNQNKKEQRMGKSPNFVFRDYVPGTGDQPDAPLTVETARRRSKNLFFQGVDSFIVSTNLAVEETQFSVHKIKAAIDFCKTPMHFRKAAIHFSAKMREIKFVEKDADQNGQGRNEYSDKKLSVSQLVFLHTVR